MLCYGVHKQYFELWTCFCNYPCSPSCHPSSTNVNSWIFLPSCHPQSASSIFFPSCHFLSASSIFLPSCFNLSYPLPPQDHPMPRPPGCTPCRLKPYSRPRVVLKERYSPPQDELAELCKPFVPKPTQSNNRWAVSECIGTRNTAAADVFPKDILENYYPLSVVDQTLAAFVIEARRAEGNFYPGSTIRNILAALYRVMKTN